MPQFLLRIDDVGRTPQDGPEHGSDHELDYFWQWREAFGIAGLPVFYAAVPQWIYQDSINLLSDRLTGRERLAVHGHDHRRRAEVSADQMRSGIERLSVLGEPPAAYVPPFNAYNEKTIQNWHDAGGKIFFGGFDGEHHRHGERPVRLPNGIIHLSANRDLYDRAAEVLRKLSVTKERDYPQVITLHVTWDYDFTALRKLRDVIADNLIGIEELETWMA